MTQHAPQIRRSAPCRATAWAAVLLAAAVAADDRVREVHTGRSWDLVVTVGGDSLRFVNDDADERYPALDDRAQRVLFASNADGDFDLHLLDLASNTVRKLTDSSTDDTFPVWTTADSLVVFVGHDRRATDLYVLDLRSLQPRRLRRVEAFRYLPAWTPSDIDVNEAPAAWFHARRSGRHGVTFDLSSVWDREQGRAVRAKLDFGDGTDTLLTRIPESFSHVYADDGVYGTALRVEDDHGAIVDVFLDLTLSWDVRLHQPPRVDRTYSPRPLDRDD